MSAETLALIYLSVAKLITYLGFFGLTGAAAVRLLVVPRGRRVGLGELAEREVRRRAGRVAGVGAGLLVAAAVARVYAQTYWAFGMEEPVTGELMRVVAFESRWGDRFMPHLVVTMLGVLGATLVVLRVTAGWWLVAVAVGGLAATLPITGHAMARPDGSVLPFALQVGHLLAVGLWLGTLATLLVAFWSPAEGADSEGRAAALVAVFSRLAIGAVAVVAVTGVGTALLYFDAWSQLWETSYGRVLVGKVVLMLATGSVGAYNWRSLKPRLSRAGGERMLVRSSSVEVTLGSLVLAITALLVHLPMPGE